MSAVYSQHSASDCKRQESCSGFVKPYAKSDHQQTIVYIKMYVFCKIMFCILVEISELVALEFCLEVGGCSDLRGFWKILAKAIVNI